MKEYHKIETLFKRSPDTKKLVEGVFANKAVEYLKDNIWQFTEKVDGTNIRVYWDGHSVSFAGRTDKAQIPEPLLNKLNDLFSGEANAQLFEQKFGDKEVILFGEGFGPKIQKGGGLYRKEVDFILFDVLIGEKYLNREDVEDIAKYFKLQTVPVLFEGTLEDGVRFVKEHHDSIVANNGKIEMEGLVARPKVELKNENGHRIIVKIKYHDFF